MRTHSRIGRFCTQILHIIANLLSPDLCHSKEAGPLFGNRNWRRASLLSYKINKFGLTQQGGLCVQTNIFVVYSDEYLCCVFRRVSLLCVQTSMFGVCSDEYLCCVQTSMFGVCSCIDNRVKIWRNKHCGKLDGWFTRWPVDCFLKWINKRKCASFAL